jgi:hypothetical protein
MRANVLYMVTVWNVGSYHVNEVLLYGEGGRRDQRFLMSYYT